MKNFTYKNWRESETELLKNLCASNKWSYERMAKEHFFDRTPSSLQAKAHRLGFDNNYQYRLYTYDKNFWKIPNEINSYWAGFSAADASVGRYCGNMYHYRLGISIKDIAHLERLKSDFKTNANINIVDKKSHMIGKYLANSSQMAILTVHSADDWYADLVNNFGICENKTYRVASPNLPDYLAYCYIIGYIDGDGCISLNKQRGYLTIKITSSALGILEWILSMIDKLGFMPLKNKPTHISKSNGGNYYDYVINGYKAIKTFQYLSDFAVPKLVRKWKNPEVLEFVKNYKISKAV